MAGSGLELLFHGIGEPPAGVPTAEIPYWIGQAAFTEIVTSAPEAAQTCEVALSVSFDDGNLSDLAIAAPLLKALAIPATFFPCAARLGRPGYLGAPELRELHAMGFEIGSHGMDHRPWPGLDEAALAREIDTARAMLEQALGHPVRRAALPFGAYDRRVLGRLRQAGLAAIHSSDPGLNPPGAWMPRRWCYRSGERFDVPTLVRRSRRPEFRLLTALKRAAKSLR